MMMTRALAKIRPLMAPHPPDRRALPWWRVFTITFWLSPIVPAWNGIGATRLAMVACVAYLWEAQEGGHTVTMTAVILWCAVFIIGVAKDFKDVNRGLATVLNRRTDDREIREAAVETAEKADAVVEKIDAKTEHDVHAKPGD